MNDENGHVALTETVTDANDFAPVRDATTHQSDEEAKAKAYLAPFRDRLMRWAESQPEFKQVVLETWPNGTFRLRGCTEDDADGECLALNGEKWPY